MARDWPDPNDRRNDAARRREDRWIELEFTAVALLSLAVLIANVGIPTERMSEWLAAVLK